MNNYDGPKIAAIIRSASLGVTLQRDMPEIVESYRKGFSLLEIVDMMNVCERYGVTRYVAKYGVRKAISGHDGNFRTGPYEGLIGDEERRELEREHKSDSGTRAVEHVSIAERIKNGREVHEAGLGIHALSVGQKSAAGKLGGDNTVKNRSGYHSLSTEKRRIFARESVKSRGFVPWGEDEKKRAYEMSLMGEYQHSDGASAGRTDYSKLTDWVNDTFHSGRKVRTILAVGTIVRNYRRRLKNELG